VADSVLSGNKYTESTVRKAPLELRQKIYDNGDLVKLVSFVDLAPRHLNLTFDMLTACSWIPSMHTPFIVQMFNTLVSSRRIPSWTLGVNAGANDQEYRAHALGQSASFSAGDRLGGNDPGLRRTTRCAEHRNYLSVLVKRAMEAVYPRKLLRGDFIAITEVDLSEAEL
jgi:hypothetical protein